VRRVLALLPLASLAACQTYQPAPAAVARGTTVQPEPVQTVASTPSQQTYRGRFSYGVERSDFDGCWLDPGQFRDRFEAAGTWQSGVPAIYEIEFVGTRRDSGRPPGFPEQGGGGYGHMGFYNCEFEMKELISSRRVQ